MMWIVGYDPKDEVYLQRRNMSYWPLRHGSPLKDEAAFWVPVPSIPCLYRGLSEYGDLYLAYLPDVTPPKRARFLLDQDYPDNEFHAYLKSLTPHDFALAVEFTYHQNWSSNAIQRLRIIYDSVKLGIPTAYALPKSGIALRGTERRGDRNLRQRALESALGPLCRRLVEDNEPVTFSTIQKELERQGDSIDVEMGVTAKNPADPKVSLFCRTMQDSFRVPCGTVQFDQVVSGVPRDWKMAGQQLESVYKVIRESMEHMVRAGAAARAGSAIFSRSNKADDQVMQDSPPNRPHVHRHNEWDKYHQEGPGFPNGSLGIVSDPPARNSSNHNYTLPALRLGRLHFHQDGMPIEESFGEWIAGLEEWNNRSFGPLRSASLPKKVLKRPLIITYRISEYSGDMEGRERWQNVDERAYAGKMVMIDVCAARRPIAAKGRPRAMSKSRKDRNYVLAADLPMPSSVMFSQFSSNARFRIFTDFADILVFDDGGYLGSIWWDGGNPKRVF